MQLSNSILKSFDEEILSHYCTNADAKRTDHTFNKQKLTLKPFFKWLQKINFSVSNANAQNLIFSKQCKWKERMQLVLIFLFRWNNAYKEAHSQDTDLKYLRRWLPKIKLNQDQREQYTDKACCQRGSSDCKSRW